MRTITFCYWLVCWSALVISVVVCSHNKVHIHYGNSSIIYVNCIYGNDTEKCGSLLMPCKTLQFTISHRVYLVKTSYVVIDINATDVCNENVILQLDNTKTRVHHWYFVGSNKTSSSPTPVYFSVESYNSVISFSYLTWRNSSDAISFNIHMSEVTFHHCTLEQINLQFTGLNTKLSLQNTAVSHCTTPNSDLPVFFMQTLYNFNATLWIKNSTFSHNKSPIIYAMQFEEIFMEDTLFLKNGKEVVSNLSMLTVSGSSVILKNSNFTYTLGTVIEVKNVKNFTVGEVIFLGNNGSASSCILVKWHSNISLQDTVFKQNTNPIVSVRDNNGVSISLKTSNFSCIQHKQELDLPFLKVPDGTNITITNCSIAKPCSVNCQNGELVKSDLYCEKCKPGSFSFNENNIIMSDSCQSCSAGTYTSNDGSTNCSLCGEGTYAQKSGSQSCKKCRNDFFTSDTGAKSCSKMTLELILIVAATVPLIVIPLLLLLGRTFKDRSLKLKARLQYGNTYNKFEGKAINDTGFSKTELL